MRFDTKIGLKSRRKTVLENFRGVDLSSSPLQVAGNRATEAYNFICENGVNHKRPGWCEFLNLGGKINGIFPFREEGGTEVLLVHAGTAIYRAVENEGVWSKEPISGKMTLTDTRSQCFQRNGKVFLVGCGDFLVYGKHNGAAKYTLVPVSEIAYVPTTTIGIGGAFTGVDNTRAKKGDVNMLTPWRQNELEVNWAADDFMDDFRLDGAFDLNTKVYITLLDGAENTVASVEFIYEGYGDGKNRSFKISSIGTVYIYNQNEDEPQIIGLSRDSDGKEGIVKAIVKFSSTTKGYREKIANCRFGTLFGVDGVSDRLFLSGNPDYPNNDFFSETEDFTYFPDGNVLTVGDADAAITGYARLSDATLAVFKGESVGNPAIYYRTGKEKTVTDTDGHAVPAAFFPTVAGTAGEYLATPYAVANLSGDVLMLSRNGVFGIELSSNISSVERYTRERSRAILGDLKKRDLSDAVGIVFRGRYYLSVGDGICYVADSRYRATFEGSADTGYEWWVWSNIPARTFAIYGDGLIFGDAKGRLCRFDERFADRYYTEIGNGEVMQSGEGLTFSTSLGLKSGDRITANGALYALVLDECVVVDGRVCFTEAEFPEVLRRLFDGAVVYADKVEGTGLKANTPYTVMDFDPASLCFSLSEDGEEAVELAKGGFRLSVKLTGVECVIRFEDGSPPRVRLTDRSGAPFELINYNGQGEATEFTAFCTHYSPVVASWASPVLDFGTNMDRKTLLGITVATDLLTGGDITFGYETRKGAWEGATRGGTGLDFNALDFDAFNFNSFTFGGAFASYTKRVNVRNFNYLRVLFRSDTEHDCAVSGITLYYKINQTNRGLW